MLSLKLLISLLLINFIFAAPQFDVNVENVEINQRNKRELSDKIESKLDLAHDIPLGLLEKSLEINDNKGDNEINGTRKLNNKNIKYFHEKNKGTVKTIVEEKDQDDNKMENVFYHLSYEKQEQTSTITPEEETTDQTPEEETTDQTPEEETTDQTMSVDDDEEITTANIIDLNNIIDVQTLSSPETSNESENNQDEAPAAAGPGWFNNWFNWAGKTSSDSVTEPTTPSDDMPDTPHLDKAISESDRYTILTPFYFGSLGLKSPNCPEHRSTEISIYFFSFCV